MSHEPALTRALQELANAPGPANLADVAISGATRARRKQWVLSGVAAVAAAVMVAAPFALKPSGQPEPLPAAAPGASAALPANETGECVQAPSVSPTEKRVAEENWPDFVRIVVAKLPTRSDYVMQSGHSLCKMEQSELANRGASDAGLKRAYAVINLGPLREHGHLTINLEQTTPRPVLVKCAELESTGPEQSANPDPPKPELLFCEEASGAKPLVFAKRVLGTLYINAIYPDFHVWMESHPVVSDQPYELGPEDLRAAVTDPALAALNR